MSEKVSVFWFRRDLRIDDNAGLYYALKADYPVLPIFIFDTNILDELEEKKDKRLSFIYDQLEKIQKELVKKKSTLHIFHGTPLQSFKNLLKEYDVAEVYTNTDYEPYATDRDKEIADYLLENEVKLFKYKDQVIFQKDEVLKDNGEPYTVYTPYSKKWKQKLEAFYLKPYPTTKYLKNLYQQKEHNLPSLKSIGFEYTEYDTVKPELDEDIAKDYKKTRDIPSIKGTTRLSVHLRFGTISIRQLAAEAKELNETLLNELIWREFFQMILWHFPKVVNHSFHEDYDKIKWRNNEKEFELWCKGETGYPIVDAGMRELNKTGYMHNRVRMVVASFLTKDLLIDWRWGEAYFAEKLLDYDLAANNGGWQWSAGCGCDAAPYFRVFNPELQTKKFDPDLKYVKKWVPEFDDMSKYAQPIVDHKEARERCLKVYKKALKDKMKETN